MQSAITTSDSEPEPDIAVVKGEARDYIGHHPFPQDIALIVEVANSTLAEDRSTKARLYARAGISTYWIINLIDSKIEVYSNPSEASFTVRNDYAKGQNLSLQVGSNVIEVPVRDLLP